MAPRHQQEQQGPLQEQEQQQEGRQTLPQQQHQQQRDRSGPLQQQETQQEKQQKQQQEKKQQKQQQERDVMQQMVQSDTAAADDGAAATFPVPFYACGQQQQQQVSALKQEKHSAFLAQQRLQAVSPEQEQQQQKEEEEDEEQDSSHNVEARHVVLSNVRFPSEIRGNAQQLSQTHGQDRWQTQQQQQQHQELPSEPEPQQLWQANASSLQKQPQYPHHNQQQQYHHQQQQYHHHQQQQQYHHHQQQQQYHHHQQYQQQKEEKTGKHREILSENVNSIQPVVAATTSTTPAVAADCAAKAGYQSCVAGGINTSIAVRTDHSASEDGDAFIMRSCSKELKASRLVSGTAPLKEEDTATAPAAAEVVVLHAKTPTPAATTTPCGAPLFASAAKRSPPPLKGAAAIAAAVAAAFSAAAAAAAHTQAADCPQPPSDAATAAPPGTKTAATAAKAATTAGATATDVHTSFRREEPTSCCSASAAAATVLENNILSGGSGDGYSIGSLAGRTCSQATNGRLKSDEGARVACEERVVEKVLTEAAGEKDSTGVKDFQAPRDTVVTVKKSASSAIAVEEASDSRREKAFKTSVQEKNVFEEITIEDKGAKACDTTTGKKKADRATCLDTTTAKKKGSDGAAYLERKAFLVQTIGEREALRRASEITTTTPTSEKAPKMRETENTYKTLVGEKPTTETNKGESILTTIVEKPTTERNVAETNRAEKTLKTIIVEKPTTEMIIAEANREESILKPIVENPPISERNIEESSGGKRMFKTEVEKPTTERKTADPNRAESILMTAVEIPSSERNIAGSIFKTILEKPTTERNIAERIFKTIVEKGTTETRVEAVAGTTAVERAGEKNSEAMGTHVKHILGGGGNCFATVEEEEEEEEEQKKKKMKQQQRTEFVGGLVPVVPASLNWFSSSILSLHPLTAVALCCSKAAILILDVALAQPIAFIDCSLAARPVGLSWVLQPLMLYPLYSSLQPQQQQQQQQHQALPHNNKNKQQQQQEVLPSFSSAPRGSAAGEVSLVASALSSMLPSAAAAATAPVPGGREIAGAAAEETPAEAEAAEEGGEKTATTAAKAATAATTAAARTAAARTATEAAAGAKEAEEAEAVAGAATTAAKAAAEAAARTAAAAARTATEAGAEAEAAAAARAGAKAATTAGGDPAIETCCSSIDKASTSRQRHNRAEGGGGQESPHGCTGRWQQTQGMSTAPSYHRRVTGISGATTITITTTSTSTFGGEAATVNITEETQGSAIAPGTKIVATTFPSSSPSPSSSCSSSSCCSSSPSSSCSSSPPSASRPPLSPVSPHCAVVKGPFSSSSSSNFLYAGTVPSSPSSSSSSSPSSAFPLSSSSPSASPSSSSSSSSSSSLSLSTLISSSPSSSSSSSSSTSPPSSSSSTPSSSLSSSSSSSPTSSSSSSSTPPPSSVPSSSSLPSSSPLPSSSFLPLSSSIPSSLSSSTSIPSSSSTSSSSSSSSLVLRRIALPSSLSSSSSPTATATPLFNASRRPQRNIQHTHSDSHNSTTNSSKSSSSSNSSNQDSSYHSWDGLSPLFFSFHQDKSVRAWHVTGFGLSDKKEKKQQQQQQQHTEVDIQQQQKQQILEKQQPLCDLKKYAGHTTMGTTRDGNNISAEGMGVTTAASQEDSQGAHAKQIGMHRNHNGDITAMALWGGACHIDSKCYHNTHTSSNTSSSSTLHNNSSITTLHSSSSNTPHNTNSSTSRTTVSISSSSNSSSTPHTSSSSSSTTPHSSSSSSGTTPHSSSSSSITPHSSSSSSTTPHSSSSSSSTAPHSSSSSSTAPHSSSSSSTAPHSSSSSSSTAPHSSSSSSSTAPHSSSSSSTAPHSSSSSSTAPHSSSSSSSTAPHSSSSSSSTNPYSSSSSATPHSNNSSSTDSCSSSNSGDRLYCGKYCSSEGGKYGGISDRTISESAVVYDGNDESSAASFGCCSSSGAAKDLSLRPAADTAIHAGVSASAATAAVWTVCLTGDKRGRLAVWRLILPQTCCNTSQQQQTAQQHQQLPETQSRTHHHHQQSELQQSEQQQSEQQPPQQEQHHQQEHKQQQQHQQEQKHQQQQRQQQQKQQRREQKQQQEQQHEEEQQEQQQQQQEKQSKKTGGAIGKNSSTLSAVSCFSPLPNQPIAALALLLRPLQSSMEGCNNTPTPQHEAGCIEDGVGIWSCAAVANDPENLAGTEKQESHIVVGEQVTTQHNGVETRRLPQEQGECRAAVIEEDKKEDGMTAANIRRTSQDNRRSESSSVSSDNNHNASMSVQTNRSTSSTNSSSNITSSTNSSSSTSRTSSSGGSSSSKITSHTSTRSSSGSSSGSSASSTTSKSSSNNVRLANSSVACSTSTSKCHWDMMLAPGEELLAAVGYCSGAVLLVDIVQQQLIRVLCRQEDSICTLGFILLSADRFAVQRSSSSSSTSSASSVVLDDSEEDASKKTVGICHSCYSSSINPTVVSTSSTALPSTVDPNKEVTCSSSNCSSMDDGSSRGNTASDRVTTQGTLRGNAVPHSCYVCKSPESKYAGIAAENDRQEALVTLLLVASKEGCASVWNIADGKLLQETVATAAAGGTNSSSSSSSSSEKSKNLETWGSQQQQQHFHSQTKGPREKEEKKQKQKTKKGSTMKRDARQQQQQQQQQQVDTGEGRKQRQSGGDVVTGVPGESGAAASMRRWLCACWHPARPTHIYLATTTGQLLLWGLTAPVASAVAAALPSPGQMLPEGSQRQLLNSPRNGETKTKKVGFEELSETTARSAATGGGGAAAESAATAPSATAPSATALDMSVGAAAANSSPQADTSEILCAGDTLVASTTERPCVSAPPATAHVSEVVAVDRVTGKQQQQEQEQQQTAAQLAEVTIPRTVPVGSSGKGRPCVREGEPENKSTAAVAEADAETSSAARENRTTTQQQQQQKKKKTQQQQRQQQQQGGRKQLLKLLQPHARPIFALGAFAFPTTRRMSEEGENDSWGVSYGFAQTSSSDIYFNNSNTESSNICDLDEEWGLLLLTSSMDRTLCLAEVYRVHPWNSRTLRQQEYEQQQWQQEQWGQTRMQRRHLLGLGQMKEKQRHQEPCGGKECQHHHPENLLLAYDEYKYYTAALCWQLQTLGGWVSSLALSPVLPSQLLVGCGDHMIRSLDLLQLLHRQQQAVLALPPPSFPFSDSAAISQHLHAGGWPSAAACAIGASSISETLSVSAGGLVMNKTGVADAASSAASMEGCLELLRNQGSKALVSQALHASVMWRGLLSSVESLTWHPTIPDVFAFGLGDGGFGVAAVAAGSFAAAAAPTVRAALPYAALHQSAEQQHVVLLSAHSPHQGKVTRLCWFLMPRLSTVCALEKYEQVHPPVTESGKEDCSAAGRAAALLDKPTEDFKFSTSGGGSGGGAAATVRGHRRNAWKRSAATAGGPLAALSAASEASVLLSGTAEGELFVTPFIPEQLLHVGGSSSSGNRHHHHHRHVVTSYTKQQHGSTSVHSLEVPKPAAAELLLEQPATMAAATDINAEAEAAEAAYGELITGHYTTAASGGAGTAGENAAGRATTHTVSTIATTRDEVAPVATAADHILGMTDTESESLEAAAYKTSAGMYCERREELRGLPLVLRWPRHGIPMIEALQQKGSRGVFRAARRRSADNTAAAAMGIAAGSPLMSSMEKNTMKMEEGALAGNAALSASTSTATADACNNIGDCDSAALDTKEARRLSAAFLSEDIGGVVETSGELRHQTSSVDPNVVVLFRERNTRTDKSTSSNSSTRSAGNIAELLVLQPIWRLKQQKRENGRNRVAFRCLGRLPLPGLTGKIVCGAASPAQKVPDDAHECCYSHARIRCGSRDSNSCSSSSRSGMTHTIRRRRSSSHEAFPPCTQLLAAGDAGGNIWIGVWQHVLCEALRQRSRKQPQQPRCPLYCLQEQQEPVQQQQQQCEEEPYEHHQRSYVWQVQQAQGENYARKNDDEVAQQELEDVGSHDEGSLGVCSHISSSSSGPGSWQGGLVLRTVGDTFRSHTNINKNSKSNSSSSSSTSSSSSSSSSTTTTMTSTKALVTCLTFGVRWVESIGAASLATAPTSRKEASRAAEGEHRRHVEAAGAAAPGDRHALRTEGKLYTLPCRRTEGRSRLKMELLLGATCASGLALVFQIEPDGNLSRPQLCARALSETYDTSDGSQLFSYGGSSCNVGRGNLTSSSNSSRNSSSNSSSSVCRSSSKDARIDGRHELLQTSARIKVKLVGRLTRTACSVLPSQQQQHQETGGSLLSCCWYEQPLSNRLLLLLGGVEQLVMLWDPVALPFFPPLPPLAPLPCTSAIAAPSAARARAAAPSAASLPAAAASVASVAAGFAASSGDTDGPFAASSTVCSTADSLAADQARESLKPKQEEDDENAKGGDLRSAHLFRRPQQQQPLLRPLCDIASFDILPPWLCQDISLSFDSAAWATFLLLLLSNDLAASEYDTPDKRKTHGTRKIWQQQLQPQQQPQHEQQQLQPQQQPQTSVATATRPCQPQKLVHGEPRQLDPLGLETANRRQPQFEEKIDAALQLLRMFKALLFVFTGQSLFEGGGGAAVLWQSLLPLGRAQWCSCTLESDAVMTLALQARAFQRDFDRSSDDSSRNPRTSSYSTCDGDCSGSSCRDADAVAAVESWSVCSARLALQQELLVPLQQVQSTSAARRAADTKRRLLLLWYQSPPRCDHLAKGSWGGALKGRVKHTNSSGSTIPNTESGSDYYRNGDSRGVITSNSRAAFRSLMHEGRLPWMHIKDARTSPVVVEKTTAVPAAHKPENGTVTSIESRARQELSETDSLAASTAAGTPAVSSRAEPAATATGNAAADRSDGTVAKVHTPVPTLHKPAASPRGPAASLYAPAGSPHGPVASLYGPAGSPDGPVASLYAPAASPRGPAASLYGPADSPHGPVASLYAPAASSRGPPASLYAPAGSPHEPGASSHGPAAPHSVGGQLSKGPTVGRGDTLPVHSGTQAFNISDSVHAVEAGDDENDSTEEEAGEDSSSLFWLCVGAAACATAAPTSAAVPMGGAGRGGKGGRGGGSAAAAAATSVLWPGLLKNYADHTLRQWRRSRKRLTTHMPPATGATSDTTENLWTFYRKEESFARREEKLLRRLHQSVGLLLASGKSQIAANVYRKGGLLMHAVVLAQLQNCTNKSAVVLELSALWMREHRYLPAASAAAAANAWLPAAAALALAYKNRPEEENLVPAFSAGVVGDTSVVADPEPLRMGDRVTSASPWPFSAVFLLLLAAASALRAATQHTVEELSAADSGTSEDSSFSSETESIEGLDSEAEAQRVTDTLAGAQPHVDGLLATTNAPPVPLRRPVSATKTVATNLMQPFFQPLQRLQQKKCSEGEKREQQQHRQLQEQQYQQDLSWQARLDKPRQQCRKARPRHVLEEAIIAAFPAVESLLKVPRNSALGSLHLRSKSPLTSRFAASQRVAAAKTAALILHLRLAGALTATGQLPATEAALEVLQGCWTRCSAGTEGTLLAVLLKRPSAVGWCCNAPLCQQRCSCQQQHGGPQWHEQQQQQDVEQEVKQQQPHGSGKGQQEHHGQSAAQQHVGALGARQSFPANNLFEQRLEAVVAAFLRMLREQREVRQHCSTGDGADASTAGAEAYTRSQQLQAQQKRELQHIPQSDQPLHAVSYDRRRDAIERFVSLSLQGHQVVLAAYWLLLKYEKQQLSAHTVRPQTHENPRHHMLQRHVHAPPPPPPPQQQHSSCFPQQHLTSCSSHQALLDNLPHGRRAPDMNDAGSAIKASRTEAGGSTAAADLIAYVAAQASKTDAKALLQRLRAYAAVQLSSTGASLVAACSADSKIRGTPRDVKSSTPVSADHEPGSNAAARSHSVSSAAQEPTGHQTDLPAANDLEKRAAGSSVYTKSAADEEIGAFGHIGDTFPVQHAGTELSLKSTVETPETTVESQLIQEVVCWVSTVLLQYHLMPCPVAVIAEAATRGAMATQSTTKSGSKGATTCRPREETARPAPDEITQIDDERAVAGVDGSSIAIAPKCLPASAKDNTVDVRPACAEADAAELVMWPAALEVLQSQVVHRVHREEFDTGRDVSAAMQESAALLLRFLRLFLLLAREQHEREIISSGGHEGFKCHSRKVHWPDEDNRVVRVLRYSPAPGRASDCGAGVLLLRTNTRILSSEGWHEWLQWQEE